MLPPELLAAAPKQPPFANQTPVSGWPEPATVEHWPTEYSLVFVVDRAQSRCLLGLKRRGMGVNLFNGYGGKPEPGETMHQCAARELHEESGLTVTPEDLQFKGLLLTTRPTDKTASGLSKAMLRIHIYACTTWSGEPIATEEMLPEWFDPKALPVTRMWPEASMYVPVVLNSIIAGKTNDIFLARVDYETLWAAAAPTKLPALVGASIQFTEGGEGVEGAEDEPLERLSGWWMGFTSAETVKAVEGAL
ncbi:hypothetical protein IAT38_002332 [Cryptococcus sp. DSM 104549]